MRIVSSIAVLLYAHAAFADGSDPFAKVKKKLPRDESAYGCTFSFENWNVYETWEQFVNFAISDKVSKKMWVDEMACGVSRSNKLNFIDYLGKTDDGIYVFLVENDGQDVSYFFNLNPSSSKGITIRYIDIKTAPSSQDRPGFFSQWANNMFGGGVGGGGGNSYTQKYGCKFYCEGAGLTPNKSGTITANTPMTNSADAQNYIRSEYEKYCSDSFPFHGTGSGSGSVVSFPYCETWYYKD